MKIRTTILDRRIKGGVTLEGERIPRPGEIYNHFKDKPYQIIAVATHSETAERMVVYQALYGDFETYVRPMEMFLSEVDHEKHPEVQQVCKKEAKEINIEVSKKSEELESLRELKELKEYSEHSVVEDDVAETEGSINTILMNFLDATSYTKKLNIISGNVKNLNDRLINDMAVSLDCAVDEGPIENRIKELIFCLQTMCRFEDKRSR